MYVVLHKPNVIHIFADIYTVTDIWEKLHK